MEAPSNELLALSYLFCNPKKINLSKKVVGLQAYQPLPLHGAWLISRPGLKSLLTLCN